MYYIRLYFYPEIDLNRAWQRRFFVRLLILCQQYCAFSPQPIIRIYQAKLHVSYFYQTRVQSLTWLISKSAVCHCSLSKLLHEFSKLLDGFVKIDAWISLSCYMDFSKLMHGFVKAVMWIYRSSLELLLWTKIVERAKVLHTLGAFGNVSCDDSWT